MIEVVQPIDTILAGSRSLSWKLVAGGTIGDWFSSVFFLPMRCG